MSIQDIIIAVIELLAGLGAFMIGFKLLTDNIEKVASRSLKKLFSKTSNRFLGVGVGVLITAILQSSSVTTVMVVGFVNSGIMNLFQATTIIMGANIGTTITAQIVALNSFKIAEYVMIFAAIGIFMNMICKSERNKTIGLALGGLGLVFLSLTVMSSSMSDIAKSEAFVNLLHKINSPIVLLLIGLVLTCILQSSSAVTTIIISMVGAGISIGSGGNAILFVIIGTNIGTCVTAILSSIGASTNAKRASLIHLLFNVFASFIFVILLLIWKDFMDDTLRAWFDKPQTQIAMFHTFFNVLSVAIFLPFTKVFVFLANRLIKEKPADEESISRLDERLIASPAVALSQASKETQRMGQMAMDALDISVDAFVKLDLTKESIVKTKIANIDIIQENLLNYLIKISSNSVSTDDEKFISILHNAINDLYREAEIADNMIKYTKTYINNDLDFSKEIFSSILLMRDKLNQQFKNLSSMLLCNNIGLLPTVEELEEEIDTMRSELMAAHMDRLEKGLCKIQNSGVFINLVSNLERAGDHLNYIAHSLVE